VKVAHVTQTLQEGKWFGGGVNYPVNLALALGELGVQVDLYSFGAKPRTEEVTENVHSIVLRHIPVTSVADNPISLSLGWRLFKGRYDVIHYHQYNTYMMVPALKAAKLSGAKFALTDHGGGGITPLKLPPVRWLVNHFIDALLLVSKYSGTLSNRSFGMLKDKTSVIYGGVDERTFKPENRSEDLRRRMSPDGKPVILFVGRVLPLKGVDVLLRAAGEMNTKVKVVVCGGMLADKYKTLLEEIIKEKSLDVSFEGFVPDELLPRYFASADVFVLPSVYNDCYGSYSRAPELLGLVMLEAMASKTPVVASSVGGVPEVIEDGVNGLLYQSGDFKALAAKLDEILSDETKLRGLSERGRESALAKFTWRRVAERTLGVYEKLLGGKA